MNQKPFLKKKTLLELEKELKSHGFTKADVARESERSYRTVHCFFKGTSYSHAIEQIVVAMIHRKHSEMSQQIVESQQRLATIFKEHALSLPKY